MHQVSRYHPLLVALHWTLALLIIAALALGARAVFLGRPVLWGLAVGGADGVAGVLRQATEELAHTMALAGRPSLDVIDRAAVRLDERMGS